VGKMMYENTLELAENKLLVLYILEQIKLPISNNQLTQIILENNFINYFTLQQYISELQAAGFINLMETDGKSRIIISSNGKKVLSLFKDRISPVKITYIELYLKGHIESIKKEITVTADYTIEKNNSFIVNLRAIENDSILIDLKINVPTNNQAKKLCSKWKSNSSQLYNDIIQLLLKD
jgi:predicted transcriptional regulator